MSSIHKDGDNNDKKLTKGIKRPAENREDDLNVRKKANLSHEEPGSNQQADDDNPTDDNRLVVAKHYNNLRENGLHERMKSRILHLRNFNNWIKSMLINEYVKRIRDSQVQGVALRVLDMCCGKGGDLLKWAKADITHLICTDIAVVSVEQCKSRYECMHADRFGKKFTAEFFPADATLVRLRERYRDPSMKLNLVSCQFAFHYCFESVSQATCMVRNAAECLQTGGYFIATIPDSNEIMRRLRASDNGRSFGNYIYNIEFDGETNPPPIFGAKYNFHLEDVVDCPEFLVHFQTLVKLCRKYGLQLERRSTFLDYYNENAESGAQLLKRMNGLETINIDRIDRNDPEYSHVIQTRRSGYDQQRFIDTLSKSEWEAISLYTVCAFRKVKYTWDSKGNAVYEFDNENENSNKKSK